jgi:hypothetical protein
MEMRKRHCKTIVILARSLVGVDENLMVFHVFVVSYWQFDNEAFWAANNSACRNAIIE